MDEACKSLHNLSLKVLALLAMLYAHARSRHGFDSIRNLHSRELKANLRSVFIAHLTRNILLKTESGSKCLVWIPTYPTPFIARIQRLPVAVPRESSTEMWGAGTVVIVPLRTIMFSTGAAARVAIYPGGA
jgi:hypothetical protein